MQHQQRKLLLLVTWVLYYICHGKDRAAVQTDHLNFKPTFLRLHHYVFNTCIVYCSLAGTNFPWQLRDIGKANIIA
jgi:hypothetical protein